MRDSDLSFKVVKGYVMYQKNLAQLVIHMLELFFHKFDNKLKIYE